MQTLAKFYSQNLSISICYGTFVGGTVLELTQYSLITTLIMLYLVEHNFYINLKILLNLFDCLFLFLLKKIPSLCLSPDDEIIRIALPSLVHPTSLVHPYRH